MLPLKEDTSPATRGSENDIPILLDPCVCSDVNLIDFNESGEIVAITQNEYDKRRIDISKKYIIGIVLILREEKSARSVRL